MRVTIRDVQESYRMIAGINSVSAAAPELGEVLQTEFPTEVEIGSLICCRVYSTCTVRDAVLMKWLVSLSNFATAIWVNCGRTSISHN